MKFNCTIEIEGVATSAEFRRILQVMLDDYEDNNPNCAEVHPIKISLKDFAD